MQISIVGTDLSMYNPPVPLDCTDTNGAASGKFYGHM